MEPYVMIPVRRGTKKMVDDYKRTHDAKSYDEAIALAVKPQSGFEILRPLRGIIKGGPPFVRDKSERTFD